MSTRENKYLAIAKMVKEAKKQIGCIEFPHFGASYPDARCIEGTLWDLDSGDEEGFTNGGNDPCPTCQTKAYIQDGLDNEISIGRMVAHMRFIFKRYGRVKTNNSN